MNLIKNTGTYLKVTEGEAIPVYSLCVIKSDGLAYRASKNNSTLCSVVGFKSSYGTIQTVGTISNTLWSLTTGLHCYLGSNGSVIQNVDLIKTIDKEFIVPVGIAKSATSIEINIESSLKKITPVQSIGINFDNGQCETSVTDYIAYANTPASTPVNGTGGSPSVTVTHNIITPLFGVGDLLFTKDATNRLGQGFSSDFTLDEGSKGKAVRLDFSYKVHSGTYVDNDIGVYIHDVTNNLLIPTSFVNLSGGNGTTMDGVVVFYATTSASYRLIFHIQTVNPLAYALRFDNFRFSLDTGVVGAVISSPVAYTMVIGAVTTPPTKGTMVEDIASYNRLGGKMQLSYRYSQSVAGVSGSGVYFYPLPSGYTIDLNIHPIGSVLGVAKASIVAGEFASETYHGEVTVYSSTAVTLGFAVLTSASNLINQQGSAYLGLGVAPLIKFSYMAEFACTQFSSSMTIVGMNEPFFLANNESVINTNGVVGKTIQDMGGTPILANTAATYYDMTLPRALMPDEVPYLEVKSRVDATWINIEHACVPSLFVFLKASLYSEVGTNIGGSHSGAAISKINTGAIRVNFMAQTVGGSSFAPVNTPTARAWSTIISAGTADGYTHWRVRIGKNDSAWAIPPTVACITADTASAISTGPLIWPSASTDTHKALNLTTGEYTVPVSGIYAVGGSEYTSSVVEPEQIRVFKNGVQVAITAEDRGSSSVSLGGAIFLPCITGDVLTIRHSVAASRTYSVARSQFIRIGS